MRQICLFPFLAWPMLCSAVSFVQPPSLYFNVTDSAWHVRFEVSETTDVEVSIVNPADSTVVRRLAAGLLGANPPAPLAANSLSQDIPWNGRDDYREPAGHPERLAVRVRAGLSLSLDRMAGGDPYASYIETQTNPGSYVFNSGLDLGDDGTVFWAGRPYSGGASFLRRYSAKGEYLKTLSPIPGEKSAAAYSGWGLNLMDSGLYSPVVNHFKWVSQGNTPLQAGSNAYEPLLLPLHGPGQLGMLDLAGNPYSNPYPVFLLNTDGTLPSVQQEKLVNSPALPASSYSTAGTPFVTVAPGRGYYYLSGLYEVTGSNWTLPVDTGFWQDGRVFKVDMATRTAVLWFSLDTVVKAAVDRAASGIGYDRNSEIHGVAVDDSGRVFVCDRLHGRIWVLDSSANPIRSLPLQYPDAVRWSPANGALYVTARSNSTLSLVKFSDWRTDTVPSARATVCSNVFSMFFKNAGSSLVVCPTDEGVIVWVAYLMSGVTLYKDEGASLALFKDFKTTGRQTAMLFDRMAVDPRTERIYAANGMGTVFKLEDWSDPFFAYCSTSAKKRLTGYDVAVDPRRNRLFVRQKQMVNDSYGYESQGPVYRYDIADYLVPAPLTPGDTNRVTEILLGRAGFVGVNDKGLAVAPNGHVAALSGQYLFTDSCSQDVRYFAVKDGAPLPTALKIVKVDRYHAGGLQFDFEGNLYVGTRPRAPAVPVPASWAATMAYREGVGSIYRYAPDGGLDSSLFIKGGRGNDPTPADITPSKIYDVDYGPIGPEPGQVCDCRSARFSVDGFGRLCVPSGLVQKVTLLDNAGNRLARFGTYGNLDDIRRELNREPGTAGKFYMAYPSATAATDDYIYVEDAADACLLRIRKVFALDNIPGFSTVFLAAVKALPLSLNAFPNPVNGAGLVRISLPENGPVTLAVFDLAGRCVKTLVRGELARGEHKVLWNGTNASGAKVAGGVYVYRLTAGHKVLTVKAILLK